MSKITCDKCRKRHKCTTPCKKIENYLQRKTKKDTYSNRWMRKKEVPYPLSVIEKLLARQKKFYMPINNKLSSRKKILSLIKNK